MNTTIAWITPWAGYAALARSLTFGRTDLGRTMGTLMAAFALCAVAGVALSNPQPMANAVLIGVLSGVAARWTAQATATAVQAQRVMCLSMTPSSAMRAWRRGWLQTQLALFAATGGVGFLVIAWHTGEGSAWLAPGAVATTQGLLAWSALARQRRVTQAWLLVPWIWPVAFLLFLRHASDLASLDLPFASMGIALSAIGMTLLLNVWRRLDPRARWSSAWAGQARPPHLRRLLQRWTPLDTRMSTYSWHPWASAFTTLTVLPGLQWLSSSQWGDVVSLSKLSTMPWLVFMIGATLSFQDLHWRHWLLPGAPRRHRLGRNCFVSTLQMYALAALAIGVVVSTVAWLAGEPWAVFMTVGTQVVQRAPVLILEFATAASMAVALSAIFRGRVFGIAATFAWRFAAAFFMAFFFGAFIFAATLQFANRSAHLPHALQIHVGPTYVLGLLVAIVFFVLLADRLWARRDLYHLMRSSRPA